MNKHLSIALAATLAAGLCGRGRAEAGLGAWQQMSVNTVYQAATDGFALAYLKSSPGVAVPWATLSGYTDASNPPTTLRGVAGLQQIWFNGKVAGTLQNSLTMPVRQNDYWSVNSAGYGGTQISVYWISLTATP